MKKESIPKGELKEAVGYYKLNSKLSGPIINKILGPAPVISNSPDNDTRDLAYDEICEYRRKVKELEKLVSFLAEEEG